MDVTKPELAGTPVGSLVGRLNQTQARILLVLMFAGKPIRMKNLARNVGAPTSQVCSAARPLVESGIIDRASGVYELGPVVRSLRTRGRKKLSYK